MTLLTDLGRQLFGIFGASVQAKLHLLLLVHITYSAGVVRVRGCWARIRVRAMGA